MTASAKVRKGCSSPQGFYRHAPAEDATFVGTSSGTSTASVYRRISRGKEAYLTANEVKMDLERVS
jgi:hypothetical protein